MSVEKKRRCNFQFNELEILVDEVIKSKSLLFGAFSATVTAKVKGNKWEAIAEKINAVCGTRRGATEVRKKWNDYKCYVKKKSVSLKKEQKLTGGGNAPTNLSPIEEKVLSMIPTCQIDGVEGGLEVGFNDDCQGVSTVETLTSSMPISVISTTLLSTIDSTLNTAASSTCSSTVTPVASSTLTSSTVTSPGTSAMTSSASVVSGSSSSTAAEVVTVKSTETKSKGKRKLEVQEEDHLERLIAIEEKKVNKLEELTSIWKDFVFCTQAYQDRDLAIKEKLLAIKQKEIELSDYSVIPTIKFPNEF